MRRIFSFIVLVALASGGCATARAKGQPEPVALDVPPPPARVIVPPEPDPPPQLPEPEPEALQQKPNRARVQPPRVDPKTDPSRAKPEAPPAVETPKAVPANPAGVPTLEQALPTSPADVERRVREQLAQAKNDLGRVDYNRLNADGKSQYDTAKRFMEQADQALVEKNLVFASKLAEKAAGLAGVLVGR